MRTFGAKDIGYSAVVTLIIMFAWPGTSLGWGKKDAHLDFTYQMKPDKKLSPEIKNISVEKPNYLYQNEDNGVMKDIETRYYDMMLRKLEDRFQKFAPNVKILDRRDIAKREAEIKGATAGTDADKQKVVAGAFVVDAQIIPRLGISTKWETIKKKSKTRFAKHIPYVGAFASGEDDTKETQVMTVVVDCEIKFQAVRTGVTIVSYAGQLVTKRQSDPGVFGFREKSLAEYEDFQVLINNMVNRHVDLFLSRLFPVTLTFDETIEKASGEACEAVSKMNSGNFEDAKMIAWRRTQKSKDPEACFVVGLVCEIQRDLPKASFWYAKACEYKPHVPLFDNSLKRVNVALENQKKSEGGKPVEISRPN